MRLFSKRNKKPALPSNLFDRVCTAAAGIADTLMKNKLMDKPDGDIDLCIWENSGYVLAALKLAGVISSSSANTIRRGIADLYGQDSAKKSICASWILMSYTFYDRQIDAMITGGHKSPDVIVYNITHPTHSDRMDFSELPILEIDPFKIVSAWSIISDIMGLYFFRKDEDIHTIRLLP